MEVVAVLLLWTWILKKVRDRDPHWYRRRGWWR